MLKTIFYFSKYIMAIALLAILYTGCSEQSISPVEQFDKPPIWGNTLSMGDLDTAPVEVELIAGQHYKVGMVRVEKFNGGIKVSYLIPEGSIEEVHVDLASTLSTWSTSNPQGFHVNSKGNPQFGQFDHKYFATVTFSNSDKTAEVVFTETNLKLALGVNTLTNDTKFYIAAHSVVCYPDNGGVSSGPASCPDWITGLPLPMTALPRDANYTMTETPAPFLVAGKTIGGYCADPFLTGVEVGETRDFNFICLDGSYIWPADCQAFHYYDNFDVLNYFLNLNMPSYPLNVSINGNNYNIGKKDAQMIIWCLLFNIDGATFNGGIGGANNPSYFPAIINDLKAVGEGFVPQCGDYIGVVAYEGADNSILCSRTGIQPYLLRVPTECEPYVTCETAMGFDAEYNPATGKWQPVNLNSALFPGHVWFRYFAFTW